MQNKSEVNIQTSKYNKFLKLFVAGINDDILLITKEDIPPFEMCKELQANEWYRVYKAFSLFIARCNQPENSDKKLKEQMHEQLKHYMSVNIAAENRIEIVTLPLQNIIQSFLIKVDKMTLWDEEQCFINDFLPIFVAAKPLVLEVSPEVQQQFINPKLRWFPGVILGYSFINRKKEKF
jgi:hypothetical protein